MTMGKKLPLSSPAAQLMAVEVISELLVSASPGGLGEALTEHLRELSGAKTVMVLARRPAPAEDELLNVSPLRRAGLFTSAELTNFCHERTPEELPCLPEDLPAEHPVRAQLMRAGVQSMVRFPLRAGGELIGQLLLFDLPEVARIAETQCIINLLSAPIALALKNALAFRRSEQQALELERRVEERTAELQNRNLELQQSEERFRLAIQATNDGLWEWNLLTHQEFFSPRLCEIVGFAFDDLEFPHCFRAWSERIHPDDHERVMSVKKSHLEGRGGIDVEYRHRHKSGEYRWQNLRAQAVFDETGTAIKMVGCIADISERKRAEQERAKLEGQLQQAQKMESVGRLAGGVAHDFNNMLTVILGNAEMGMMNLDPAHPLAENLAEIMRTAEHSADLTRQLLGFARKQTIVPKPLDLNETLIVMLKMLQRLIGEDIRLTWQPASELWQVKMDPSQIDQILANLCVNARDAIKDTGRITIETENSTVEKEYCETNLEATPGEYARLTVSDDGSGMDKETLQRVFEPFFTTKELGRGTGLGLATVYGIVKQNKGFINVYSEPGQGTAFSIYLPRYVETSDPVAKENGQKPIRGGQETILLVEDDLAILNLAAKILRRHGYEVLTAGDPNEAMKLAREHTGQIHMIMSDVIMPGMNGLELAKDVLSLHPHIKRLFMSGYTADTIAQHGVLNDGVHFIHKPFSVSEVTAKVREVLDSKEQDDEQVTKRLGDKYGRLGT